MRDRLILALVAYFSLVTLPGYAVVFGDDFDYGIAMINYANICAAFCSAFALLGAGGRTAVPGAAVRLGGRWWHAPALAAIIQIPASYIAVFHLLAEGREDDYSLFFAPLMLTLITGIVFALGWMGGMLLSLPLTFAANRRRREAAKASGSATPATGELTPNAEGVGAVTARSSRGSEVALGVVLLTVSIISLVAAPELLRAESGWAYDSRPGPIILLGVLTGYVEPYPNDDRVLWESLVRLAFALGVIGIAALIAAARSSTAGTGQEAEAVPAAAAASNRAEKRAASRKVAAERRAAKGTANAPVTGKAPRSFEAPPGRSKRKDRTAAGTAASAEWWLPARAPSDALDDVADAAAGSGTGDDGRSDSRD